MSMGQLQGWWHPLQKAEVGNVSLCRNLFLAHQNKLLHPVMLNSSVMLGYRWSISSFCFLFLQEGLPVQIKKWNS